MSFLTGITTILNADIINGGKTLVGEAECDDIAIKGKYLIIQLDSNNFKQKVIDTIYKAGSARCVCDYVIVSDSVILICELKSNNTGHMQAQLKNTGRLMKYVLEMVKEHGRIGSEIPPVKYVCFAKKYSYNKQTTTFSKLSRITWQGSELFQLPCNSTYHLHQFLNN